MKLIAYNVSNLTDARYFAAKGAHMIGFAANQATIDEVNAIKDWVDVPAFFVQLPSSANAEMIWEWSERTGIQCFLVDGIKEEVMNLFPSFKWITFFDESNDVYEDFNPVFFHEQDRSSWSDTSAPSRDVFHNHRGCYLDVSSSLSIEPGDENIFTGVLISGSEEDKIGVKSYDEIDDFLDEIDIEF